MSLLGDIREAAAPAKRCRIADIREDLGEKEGAELQAALDDPAIGPGPIIRVLRGRGHKLGDHALRAHRRRECTCYRA